MKLIHFLFCLITFAFLASASAATPDALNQSALQTLAPSSIYPIGVWLQDPSNAAKYKAIGINIYIGLWNGPTEKQLTALEKAGMPVLCDQNPVALQPKWKNEILGWLQDDEPDNAQSLPDNKGYGPPITPEKIVARYNAMKAADPTRPVMLNLGQGVAWDGWYGRGVRSNKPQDYPQYINGGDLISFDIYPVVHDSKQVAGKLWYVGYGVGRLVQWTGDKKPIWTCIECTHIGNAAKKPTPDQVKSEVWMAIIHGARGILYFAHQFAPKFIEAAVLQDPQMSAAIADINAEIQTLAPVITTPADGDQATAHPAETPGTGKDGIALATRHYKGATYIFAVSMTDQPIQATFTLKGATGDVQVSGEQRTIHADAGKWTDDFKDYQVHRYIIGETVKSSP